LSLGQQGDILHITQGEELACPSTTSTATR
jgi:hypothetical protein